jgi:uncharacterized protein (DUF1499 family)
LNARKRLSTLHFRVPKSLLRVLIIFYAECTSAVFGFVDDLELHLRIAEELLR